MNTILAALALCVFAQASLAGVNPPTEDPRSRSGAAVKPVKQQAPAQEQPQEQSTVKEKEAQTQEEKCKSAECEQK